MLKEVKDFAMRCPNCTSELLTKKFNFFVNSTKGYLWP